MSKLEELIAELCPNGVEYRKLGEIAPPTRGVRVIRSQLSLEDKYPVYQNSMTPLGYYTESNCHANTVFIISAGAAGEIGYSTVPFWAADDCFYFICPKNLKSRFLYYALMCQREHLLSRVRRASVPRLAHSVIDGLNIPLPPLPVQEEIVRILDSFTELTAELTAELAARKKQYEYYKQSLLTSEDHFELKPLGEVCTVQAGGTPSKSQADYWDDGEIKWLGSTVCKNQKTVDEITNYITELGLQKSSAKLMKKDTTLIALVGATIGKVAFLSFEATINQNIAGVYPINDKEVLPSYIYYVCTMLYSKFLELGNGKLAMANLTFVRSLQIPIPYQNDIEKSLAEQQRIVAILDRFDTLCNDISVGLPAEIAARRQQYEYYRDRLLTFKNIAEQEA